ncbi:MAG TPA: plastocyanin/azurin family copper-binding protein [Longimicrobiales bacterium]|nr:plastocyanin/azurin family copper-binding protein [Longimicrobiales bacterium]
MPILAAAGLLGAGLLACGDAGPVEPLADCLDAAGVTGPAVGIRNFTFIPDTLRVDPGARVTWVNCEDPALDAHTTTADGGEWDSGLMSAGETFERQFDQTGAFPYHCVPHPSMAAVVIVDQS